MRLDQKLHLEYPNVSRSAIQKLIKDGLVTINGSLVTKTSSEVSDVDKIKLDYDFNVKPSFSDLEIEIIYEDSDCVVINKPEGILTHSKGMFNPEATVASWLAERKDFEFPSANSDALLLQNQRLGIAHRLDRATSGVMILAKNQTALRHLQKQFQDRKAHKVYVARVEGGVEPSHAIIDLPIERHPKYPQKFRVGSDGKSAETEYKVAKVLDKGVIKDSLIELWPKTGRTHQLRVHLNYIKHPIIGDTFYGGRSAERLFLHSKSLEITLPNKSRRTFEVPTPKVFYD